LPADAAEEIKSISVIFPIKKGHVVCGDVIEQFYVHRENG